ncbi:MAG: hypothetical protein HYZ39_17285 [Mycolicibacterium cosmeticum]|nr:hypothetical protein [Mycolicibacterium cosmeticum]
MGIQPDISPFGSQTVTGPGWPNVDEDALGAAAAQYEALAAKISGTVVPQQQGQLMKLADVWQGGSAIAAAGEATTIIGGHESNGAQAAAIGAKLRSMQAAVVATKTLVNTMAEETNAECMALQSMPYSNAQELVQARIKLGLSQNTATVTGNATELANTVGAPPQVPASGPPEVGAQQLAGQDPQQAMQMLSQMGSMLTQLPQQLGQALGQAPQQMMQPLQQLTQPLQQLTSMLGKGGSPSGAGMGPSPFSAFSNHPLAGGSGAGGGAGMVRAAGLPGGGGGGSAQTPLMASLVGKTLPVAVAPAEAAAGAMVGGVAPVAAGGGSGMGGMGGGMMGQRGAEGGGTKQGLALPPSLDYGEDDVDDDEW